MQYRQEKAPKKTALATGLQAGYFLRINWKAMMPNKTIWIVSRTPWPPRNDPEAGLIKSFIDREIMQILKQSVVSRL